LPEGPFSLAEKRLLIIGAYSGIGEDFCAFAASQGAQLYCLGRQRDRLDALRASLGPSIVATAAIDIQSVDQFREEVRAFASGHGPFDGAFHCAGRELLASVRSLNDRDFAAIFSGSFMGASALVALGAGKSLLAPGGSLVLMSSVTARRPQPGMAYYSASKAAIDALVQSAASEYAARRSRINSIVAGAVGTPMLEQSLRTMPEPAKARYESAHRLGFGSPRDVSHAAGFLLSDASRWITGSALVVDGGFLTS
jgi:NAD(P)-dependent dehydrogenase (short-subunit alcohol dehydrogenase family)